VTNAMMLKSKMKMKRNWFLLGHYTTWSCFQDIL